MRRSKRMLIVMLTSFGILFFLTFLTFAGYGQSVCDLANLAQNRGYYVSALNNLKSTDNSFFKAQNRTYFTE